MRRYSAGIIAAIAATAVLATPAWGQTTTTTKAQYVDEVNPICKDSRGDAKRARRKAGRTGNPGVDFIRKTVAFQRVFKRTLRRIAAVEPPAEIAEPVGDWVDALRRTKRLTDQFIRAAKAGNGAASVRLVKKISKAQTQSSNKAKRLDLDRCTQ
jgi:hypothetical protein